MSIRYKNLKGERFGKLTVLKLGGRDKWQNIIWSCLCDCGIVKDVQRGSLTAGLSKSCGCEMGNKKHGLSNSKLYHIREGMLARCNNQNATSYRYYGGRGINICSEWLDARKFIKWATKSGYEDGLQIDRIDNDDDYYPENCRWVTPEVNGGNKSNNRILRFRGKKQTVAQWGRELGIPFNRIHTRLSRGWNITKALSTKNFRKSKGGSH